MKSQAYQPGEGELEWAIFERDYPRIERAIRAGADPDAFDGGEPSDSSPLMYAVHEGDVKLAKKLLELGANPNLQNSAGHTALATALLEGKRALVKLLEPLTNAKARKRAAEALAMHQRRLAYDEFLEAVHRNDVAKVRRMIKDGFDPNGRGAGTAQTALYTAAMGAQRFPMLKLLVEGGANPNGHRHWRPIIPAAREGDAEIIHYLVKHGAQLDVTDPDGRSPIINAARRGNFETFKALVECGVSLHEWGANVLFEIEQNRQRIDWNEKKPACEQMEKMVNETLNAQSGRGSWLRAKR